MANSIITFGQISTTAGQTSINSAIDCTGGDYLVICHTAYDSDFAPTPPSAGPAFDGNAMTLLHQGSGAGIGTGGANLYGIHGVSGSANLTITFPTNEYGPAIMYYVLSGVVQSATAANVRRTVVQDATEGSSISIALGAGQGLAAGDLILYFGLDWEGDVTHTPSGVCVEDQEGSHINDRGIVIGHFLATGTSHTGGWTSGNLMTGFAMAMIPAAAGGVEITVPPATLSISGQVPLVGTGKIVNAPLATISVAGQVPAVGTGALTTVPVALLTIAGLVPAVTGGLSVEVPADSIAVTGFTPATAGAGMTVAVPLNQITISGFAPGVAATHGADIAVPADHIAVLGQMPRVITSFTLNKNTEYEVYVLNPKNSRWEHTRIAFTGTDFGAIQ